MGFQLFKFEFQTFFFLWPLPYLGKSPQFSRFLIIIKSFINWYQKKILTFGDIFIFIFGVVFIWDFLPVSKINWGPENWPPL